MVYNIISMEDLTHEEFLQHMQDYCYALIDDIEGVVKSTLSAAFANIIVLKEVVGFCATIDEEKYRSNGGVARIYSEVEDIVSKCEFMDAFDSNGIENAVLNELSEALARFKSAMTDVEKEE